MITEATVNGRKALVQYINDDFEPVDNEADATMIRVNFVDDQGGSAFLRPATEEQARSAEAVRRQRMQREREKAEQLMSAQPGGLRQSS